MIVVVETNFIVELVLRQEDALACAELIDLCSGGGAQLVIPAFAVAEAGMVLEERSRERREFIKKDLQRHAREIGRTSTQMQDLLSKLDDELLRTQVDADVAWLDFRCRLDRMEVIAMTEEVLEETIAIQVGREIERLPDAIVFASVKKYLESIRNAGNAAEACFVSRDDKAFQKEKILKQLRKLDCTFINSFSGAAARMRAALSES